MTPLLDALRTAALTASQICRHVQQRLGEIRAITKDDRSPVTVADLASQVVVTAELVDALGPTLDGRALVAEEDSRFLRREEHAAHLSATLEAVRTVRPEIDTTALLNLLDLGQGDGRSAEFFTVDPVDGTKGFLRGQQYAIALAFVRDTVPLLGVLACPNLPRSPSVPLHPAALEGSLYLAERGAGAEEQDCLVSPISPARRLPPVSPELNRPLRACASVEKAHTSHSETSRLLERVGADRELVRLDSSAKYAVVARGQADAYLRLPTRADYVERIWDHAAGVVVASEAGCIVTDVAGLPLSFGLGRGLEHNRGVVVASPTAHAHLIRALAELESAPS